MEMCIKTYLGDPFLIILQKGGKREGDMIDTGQMESESLRYHTFDNFYKI